MFAVTAIVLVISMGWRFGGYLDKAAAGAMSEEILFILMAYRLPGFLELILPTSFFLAIMLVYGRLHVDNEMIVLQSSGVSTQRIVVMTLLMSVLVMVLTALIALWLKPLGERQVEALLIDQKNLTEFDTLAPGRFQVLSSGDRVTYTQEISDDGQLSGIFINEFPGLSPDSSPRDTITVIAESGRTQLDDDGRRFLVLENGSRYRGIPGQRAYRVIQYEEYGQLVERRADRREHLRNSAIPTMALLGDPSPVAASEFHWRLSVVLMIPVMALMAVPLARVNPRQGRFTRLVPAMILCFVYIISLSSARSGLEKGNLPAALGMWWIHALFIALAAACYRLDSLTAWFTGLVPSKRPSPGK